MDLNKAVPPCNAKIGGKGTGTRWGCRIKQNWLQEPIEGNGKACEQVPVLICDTCARRILCAATIWGVQFALYEQNNPPKYLSIHILQEHKVRPWALANIFGIGPEMGLEGGVYLYHNMTPPIQVILGSFFEGWSQILHSTKLFRHGFEQSCSAMATQKLEEKVQEHDEVVESSKTDCRSQSRAHGKAYEQVPALICDTCASATIWGVSLLSMSKIPPPNIWWTNLKFLT